MGEIHMKYIPIKLGKNVIALDKTNEWKECLDYAIKHNCDVIYDDLKNVNTIEVMYKFQSKGFNVELSEIEVHKIDKTIEKVINCRFNNCR